MKNQWLRHSIRSWVLLICSALSCVEPLLAGQIRSWDSANQRCGDLFNADAGELAYSGFETLLLNRGHVVLPGVSTMDSAALSEVEVFFWGTSEHQLSPEEALALDGFVRGGGCLILETNSVALEATAANLAYNALGLGDRIIGYGNGEGVFQDVISATTIGPLGDLRGQIFATTFARMIDHTGHTLVGVSGGSTPSMVEFQVGDGMVLGLGDPYGLNWFEADSPNNLYAYLNFIENCLPTSNAPISIEIMIKGGGAPAPINCRNDRGVIVVVILSTMEFDATTVDHETVRFEGAAETHVDKRTGLLRRHEKDIDRDGDTDLVFHFRFGTTELTCDSTDAALTGRLFDGSEFIGVSEVRMISGTRIITVR